MTKKLKLKFMVILMSIMTVMLCIILSMIWFFTKRNLENDSIHMMQNIADKPFLLPPPDEPKDAMRLPYITIQLDRNKELLSAAGGYYDLTDENFLKKLIDSALLHDAPVGLMEDYNLRFLRRDTPAGYTLVYADISSEQATLNHLLRNCIFIGLICFVIFLVISFLLASWVVRPVDKAWEQQRRFIADASHELKTPLTVIMTNAELLLNPDYDKRNHITLSSSILVMSKQMRSLLEQMLELARTDSIQSNTIFSSVNFSQIISDAILPFEPVFFEKSLTLQTDITEHIMINGDASQLRQVLDILLDNATKYSCEKGNTWVSLHKRGKGHCLLTVANEGKEISTKDLQHLFKRFYRADQARSRTGSFGLGLSIAKSIVLRHKGKIWVESNHNINTFFVEYPLSERKFS